MAIVTLLWLGASTVCTLVFWVTALLCQTATFKNLPYSDRIYKVKHPSPSSYYMGIFMITTTLIVKQNYCIRVIFFL
jgi:hypothetical protein